MAKSRAAPPSPAAAAPPQYASPPDEVLKAGPAYAEAPVGVLERGEAFDAIRQQCNDATYSLLDVRDKRWHLLVFGGGTSVRVFSDFQEGVDFVREAGITNCRCLHLSSEGNPLGVIR